MVAIYLLIFTLTLFFPQPALAQTPLEACQESCQGDLNCIKNCSPYTPNYSGAQTGAREGGVYPTEGCGAGNSVPYLSCLPPLFAKIIRPVATPRSIARKACTFSLFVKSF